MQNLENTKNKDLFVDSNIEDILSYIHQISVKQDLGPFATAIFTKNFLYANLPPEQMEQYRITYGKIIDNDMEYFVTVVGKFENPDMDCFILLNNLSYRRVPSSYIQQLHERHLFLILKEMNEKENEHNRKFN